MAGLSPSCADRLDFLAISDYQQPVGVVARGTEDFEEIDTPAKRDSLY